MIDEYLRRTMEQNFTYFDKCPHYTFNFSGSNRYRLMQEYFPKDFERALGFSLPRRPDPAMQPARRTHTKLTKPPRPITHPHLRYIALQPMAAPAPGGWCGTGLSAYRAFMAWLDRLATYKGLVDLEVVSVRPFAHQMSHAQWRKLAKQKWLDIGVPSIRNLSSISKTRAFMWLLLGLTSVPLNLV